MSKVSVWDIVQRALIDEGIDTYAPAQKQGDCKEPYAVLRDSGSTSVGSFSTQRRYYTLLCYVPRDAYYKLLPFVDKCKEIMAKEPIYPMLVPTGVETPSFFDDTYNAHMISIQYRSNMRNEHI